MMCKNRFVASYCHNNKMELFTVLIGGFAVWALYGMVRGPSNFGNDINSATKLYTQYKNTPADVLICDKTKAQYNFLGSPSVSVPCKRKRVTEINNLSELILASSVKGKSKGEIICRGTLQYMYDCEFPTKRPKFLTNPETGRRLELDCYNENINIAVEYNGEQHYKYTPFIQKGGETEFVDQVKRDKLKATICKKQKVNLIIVPYTVKHDMIPKFIECELDKLKL